MYSSLPLTECKAPFLLTSCPKLEFYFLKLNYRMFSCSNMSVYVKWLLLLQTFLFPASDYSLEPFTWCSHSCNFLSSWFHCCTRHKLLWGATTKQPKSNFAHTPVLLEWYIMTGLPAEQMTDLKETFSRWLRLKSARYKGQWLLIDRSKSFHSKPW